MRDHGGHGVVTGQAGHSQQATIGHDSIGDQDDGMGPARVRTGTGQGPGRDQTGQDRSGQIRTGEGRLPL